MYWKHSIQHWKEFKTPQGNEGKTSWRLKKVRKPVFLHLCLAAPVININSTKQALIKLLSAVNDSERQTWNIKRTQTIMHKHRHEAECIFPVCTALLPHHHFHSQTPTHSWFLIVWAIRNTITDFCMQKREKVNSTKYTFLRQITFFQLKKYLAGTHPSEHVFLRKHACTHHCLKLT